MAQSLTNLLMHVVFSTKERLPLVTKDLKPNLLAYMGGIVRELDGKLLAADGTTEHVHLLMRVPPTLALADAIRVVRTNSSRWARKAKKGHDQFRWQAGYAAFSVSESKRPGGRTIRQGPRTAPPQGLIPGGVGGILEETRNRIRRAVHLGVKMLLSPLQGWDVCIATLFPGLTPWAVSLRPCGAWRGVVCTVPGLAPWAIRLRPCGALEVP